MEGSAVSTRSRFYWLPNFFTGSRLVLTVPILLAAAEEQWVLAFWLYIIALLTDFADGYAAIRFNARSPLGELLDPIADFSLAASGVAILLWTDALPAWAGVVMMIPALMVGYINLCTPKQSEVHRKHHLLSVPYLFAVWTAGAWYLAT